MPSRPLASASAEARGAPRHARAAWGAAACLGGRRLLSSAASAGSGPSAGGEGRQGTPSFVGDVASAVRTGRVDAVEAALAATGSPATEVNRPDHKGWTPVMHAAYRGYAQVVELLAEAGADLDHAEAAKGFTALRLAIRQKHKATVAMLLARRASAHAVSADGHSPLTAAAMSGAAVSVRLLIANGADPSLELKVGTPLMIAARYGHKSAVSVLVQAGVDVNQQSPLNKCTSALLQAVAGGHRMTAEYLIRNGADVNQPNIYGTTPLMKAARHGDSGTVLLLLSNGADPSAVDMYENTALKVAEEHGFDGCATLIRDAIDGAPLPPPRRAQQSSRAPHQRRGPTDRGGHAR